MLKFFKYTYFFALNLVLFNFTVAQITTEPSGGGITTEPSGGGPDVLNTDIGGLNPLRFDSFPEFLAALLDVIVNISLPILVLAIIYTGFLFVTARGNEQKLSAAKTAFVWTMAGAAIILGAFVIANIIEGTVSNIRADAHLPGNILNEFSV